MLAPCKESLKNGTISRAEWLAWSEDSVWLSVFPTDIEKGQVASSDDMESNVESLIRAGLRVSMLSIATGEETCTGVGEVPLKMEFSDKVVKSLLEDASCWLARVSSILDWVTWSIMIENRWSQCGKEKRGRTSMQEKRKRQKLWGKKMWETEQIRSPTTKNNRIGANSVIVFSRLG